MESPGGLLPKEKKILIRGIRKRILGVFEKACRGHVGRQLDQEFEDFTMPKISKRLNFPPTPSNIVLGMDEVTIRLSELKKYESVLARAGELSAEIRGLEQYVDRVNRIISAFLEKTNTVYRGTTVSNLANMIKMNGKVGFQSRRMYAAKMDYVSSSIDANVAMIFAKAKGKRGITIEMDVSEMSPSSYAPVTYEPRHSVYVTPRGMHEYGPYERFGGTNSAIFMLEYEVQIKKGAKPPIRGIIVSGKRKTRFKRRLENMAEILEKMHKREIKIKYLEDGS